MSTVFQFGQAQFVKDLIFGWHFRPTDDDDWMGLVDFPSDVLKELSTSTLPTYVPDDLKATLLGELKRRQVQERYAMEMGTAIVGAWKKHDDRINKAETTISRLKDRIKVMTAILANMDQNRNSDIGYAKIKVVSGQWYIYGDYDEPPECLPSIDKAVDRIMARWW